MGNNHMLSMYHCRGHRSVDRNRGDIFHQTDLNVTPPVAAKFARALREVDVLVRVRVVERLLVTDTTCIAMEGDTSERALRILHL